MLSSQDVRMPAVSSNDDWIEESFDLVKFINTESPRNSQELTTPVMEQNPFPFGHDMEKGSHLCQPFPAALEDDIDFDLGGFVAENNMYPQESLATDDYTPNSSTISNGSQYQPAIKTEEYDPDFNPQSVTSQQTSNDDVEYVPQIKPRKYKIKPESERNSPTYKQKRAKNNDAVRKSRSKAKLQQQIRDQQLHEYEVKVKNLEEQHQVDQKTIAEQKQEINRLRERLGYFEGRRGDTRFR
uniref:BZIP domain-containing protein n=1 Tax=Steinernema glaseri TaxID=37863 RepID=A0A1I8A1I0_9BILA